MDRPLLRRRGLLSCLGLAALVSAVAGAPADAQQVIAGKGAVTIDLGVLNQLGQPVAGGYAPYGQTPTYPGYSQPIYGQQPAYGQPYAYGQPGYMQTYGGLQFPPPQYPVSSLMVQPPAGATPYVPSAATASAPAMAAPATTMAPTTGAATTNTASSSSSATGTPPPAPSATPTTVPMDVAGSSAPAATPSGGTTASTTTAATTTTDTSTAATTTAATTAGTEANTGATTGSTVVPSATPLATTETTTGTTTTGTTTTGAATTGTATGTETTTAATVPPAPAAPATTGSDTGSPAAASGTAASGTAATTTTTTGTTQTASVPPGAATEGEIRIAFPADSADIPDSVKAQLNALAQKMASDDNMRIQLLAYASGTSEQASRARRMSLSRALAVRSYLIQQGVRSTRMDVRALGNNVEGSPADRVDIIPKAQ
jgi:outer membrane protein OmpA-like peptidoglycan-associated protein